MASSDPFASTSFNPTDSANFNALATKSKAGPKGLKVRAGKLKTTIKFPKSGGGLKGFATAKKLGAKAMNVKTPKVPVPKMPSMKPSKYVVG